MARRVRALILLLVAMATCTSQGLSMTLCRCTGHLFAGSVPESCCGECPEEEAPAIRAADSIPPAGCLMLSSPEDCFVVVSKGWETYLPASGKEPAPAPMLTAAEPLATLALIPDHPRHALMGLVSWNLIHHQTEPSGPSRVLLYHSLLI